jgi:lipopolysaccharide biosynthesis regulator YciM
MNLLEIRYRVAKGWSKAFERACSYVGIKCDNVNLEFLDEISEAAQATMTSGTWPGTFTPGLEKGQRPWFMSRWLFK